MGHYLDTELLAALTRSKRGSRGLREIAKDIGDVSPSTLSRVENGKMPDMETFLLLCDWLGVPPAELIKNTGEISRTSALETPEVIAIQLRADKDLDPSTANALAALVKAAYYNLLQPTVTPVTQLEANSTDSSGKTLLERLSSEFRQSCEEIAVKHRHLLRLKAFDPLPADTLAKSLNAVLFTPDEVPEFDPKQKKLLLDSNKWSAAVVCLDPLWIVYNPLHTAARRESNLMHELAHILLEHSMVYFEPKTGMPKRRQQDEDEATYLGGCLQIPRRGLLWATEQKMTKAQVAEHFGASEAMVQFRSNVTGVKQFVE